jgi:predicted phage-related endonuclease
MNAVAIPAERKKWLGGSDIAALLGIAPETWSRNTPLALYFDKIEPRADTQGLAYKRRGHRWEAVVAEMLTEKLKEQGHAVEILGANQRYIDQEVPYFACEIDYELRLDSAPETVNVELKTVHPLAAREWGEETDAIPLHYNAQAIWGLGITRRQRCIVAPLFGADEIRCYEIAADQELIADIRNTARTFWEQHVIPRVPPPPGGLVDLARLFPRDVGTTVALDGNEKVIDALFELRQADRDIKLGKDRWDQALAIIEEFMGASAIATLGGEKVCTWRTQNQKRIDISALRETMPEIASQFERATEFRKFLLTRGKS